MPEVELEERARARQRDPARGRRGPGAARSGSCTRTASARPRRALGAARYCIEEAVKYAKSRMAFGEPLSKKQGMQWPLVELHAECEMLRNFIFRTAWQMDRQDPLEISDRSSICNFRANRLACEAADRAMQVHGGIGYTRAHAVRAHLPPPPPLPDHRRLGGDADAPRRAVPVRLSATRVRNEHGRRGRRARRHRCSSRPRAPRPIPVRAAPRRSAAAIGDRTHGWAACRTRPISCAAGTGGRCCASSPARCSMPVGTCDRPRIPRAPGIARPRRAGASAAALLHAEREILGTPFYLMEWLQGRVFEYVRDARLVARRAACLLSMSMCASDGGHPPPRLARGRAGAITAGLAIISPAS